MKKVSSLTRQTISISEANSYLACRKKHDYRYRQLLVPAEEKRPLILGKAVHIGLESIYETGKVDHALQSAGEYLALSVYGEELTPLVQDMARLTATAVLSIHLLLVLA